MKEHPTKTTNLSIVTFNTWGIPLNATKNARMSAIASQIKKLDADIILLQELWELKDYNTLMKECDYPYVTEYGLFPYIGKYAGMAIMSKYPIVKTEKIDYRWRSTLPNYIKAAMRSEVIVAGRKISVFNTHLTANLEVSLGDEHNLFGKIMFTSDCEEETRWDQLKTLTYHINKALRKGHEIVVGGDFNAGPRYPLWYRWEKRLKNKFSDLFKTMSYTQELPSTYENELAKQDQGQLDHIITFGSTKVLKSKVVLKTKQYMCFKNTMKKLNLSDHFGILSIIEIQLNEE